MAFRNIGVFRDSESLKWHLDRFTGHTPNEWAVYDDLGHFLNSGHPHNIAFLHSPYPFIHINEYQARLDQIYDRCDLIFIICTELHDLTEEFIMRNDKPKIVYYLCGALNSTLKHATTEQFFDWFETSRYFYKNYLPEILGRLQPGPKERYFDVLLGRKKQHRDYAYEFVKNTLLPGNTIVTYFNKLSPDFGTSGEKWIWESKGVKFENTPKMTVDLVSYFGHNTSISQIIPIDIYNLTAYSVVAETNCNSRYSFYTEKTAKPIIARRLFIMFAGRHYLRNLRKLGFRTFTGIIDESYDEESDDLFRWEMACRQMQWLCQQDQSVILEKIKPIVDHNFKVMMETDWLKNYIDNLESKIDTLVQQIESSPSS